MTMKALVNQQTNDRSINQIQQFIAQTLQPLITNPLLFGNIVSSVQLKTGTNIVNHGLGRMLQGWSLVRKRGAADVYDQQDTNPNPSKTLVLVSTADVSVDVYCF